MKKKILLSVLLVFVFALFTVNVNAAITTLDIPNTTKAKAPDRIPATGDQLHGTVTEVFNFSKVKFAPESGSESINGKTDLRKIILGVKNNLSASDTLTLDTVFSSWFTAYCLDNAKKYPEYGLLTAAAYQTASTDQAKLDIAVLAAVATDDNIQTAIKNKGLDTKKILGIEVLEDVDGDITRFYELVGDGETATTAIAKIETLNTKVTINLKKISFLVGGDFIYVNAADIPGHNGDNYTLEFYGQDILLEKYITTNNSSVSGYDHALWIIEHSYPTLSLKTSIEEAGGDYNELRKEICQLHEHTFDDSALSCEGFADLDDYVENYVYGTVQYAIWKTTDHAVEGKRLGNSVENVAQLNKLYKYLIDDSRDYDGYSTKTFKNKITVKAPKEKEELYKETSSAYIYGPYKVSYDVLAGGDMTLAVTNADKTGIRLIDKDGNEISTISKGGTFYIECAKKQKISSVSVSVKLTGASVFDPLTNRGRIYFPQYKLEQNVMSGGKIVNKDLETAIELVTNPETGVENVALLLMVTLIAFTLAYLILSYKQKSVSLN